MTRFVLIVIISVLSLSAGAGMLGRTIKHRVDRLVRGSARSGSGRALGPALLLALAAAAAVPGLGWGQSVKLSLGMPFSDVDRFEISPDGARVVYSHDADTDDAFELWSVPISGGTPVRLSGLLPSGIAVGRWLITPDGGRVVYEARQDNFFVSELYQAPIAGGVAPVKLNGPGVVGVRGISDFLISPAGDRVVYVAFNGSNRDVFSVPITGGSPVKLNPTLVTGGNVDGIIVGPSGDRVVYRADQDTDDVFELYSVPIAGGSAVKLNDPLVTGGNVSFGVVTPDGTRVVYSADQDLDEFYSLYSVPITGGTVVQLNGGLVLGGDVQGFGFTPDGSRVVYRADQQTDEVIELYSVPTGGGIAHKLSRPEDGRIANRYTITPDSMRVLYVAGSPVENLYSVSLLGGSAPIQLNRVAVPPASVGGRFVISPDGNWVVYLQNSAGYMMSPDGPAGSGVLAWGLQLHDLGFAIDPTSRNVVVAASRQGEADPVRRLWQAPLGTLNNFTPTELVPAADFVTGGNVKRDIDGVKFAIGPLGSIVYIADQDADEVFELYRVQPVQDLIFGDDFE